MSSYSAINRVTSDMDQLILKNKTQITSHFCRACQTCKSLGSHSLTYFNILLILHYISESPWKTPRKNTSFQPFRMGMGSTRPLALGYPCLHCGAAGEAEMVRANRHFFSSRNCVKTGNIRNKSQEPLNPQEDFTTWHEWLRAWVDGNIHGKQ